MNSKNHKAFTLVEIMVVVAIIALLAAIAIPNLIRAKVNANEASAQASLKAISNALENFAAINSQYPTVTSALIGDKPPYLSVNYFSGTYNGYSYTASLDPSMYSITAAPVSANFGVNSYTISTGAVLVKNP